MTYVSDPATLRNPAAINFANYRLIYLPSSYRSDNPYGITDATNNAFITRSADLVYYVNNLGGSLVVLTQAYLSNPYGFLPSPLSFVAYTFPAVQVTADMALFSPTSNSGNLYHDSWHGYFTGPTDWSGIYRVLVHQTGSCSQPNGQNQTCHATMVANYHAKLTAHTCYDKATSTTSRNDPACWRSVSAVVGQIVNVNH